LYQVLSESLGSGSAVTTLWQRPGLDLASVPMRAAATLQLFRRGETLALMPNIFWR
jgi:hypothetical protein